MRGAGGAGRDMVGLTRGLISSVVKSLELVVRSLGIAAREAPAPVMATLLFALIATTYFVSQVCPAGGNLSKRSLS